MSDQNEKTDKTKKKTLTLGGGTLKINLDNKLDNTKVRGKLVEVSVKGKKGKPSSLSSIGGGLSDEGRGIENAALALEKKRRLDILEKAQNSKLLQDPVGVFSVKVVQESESVNESENLSSVKGDVSSVEDKISSRQIYVEKEGALSENVKSSKTYSKKDIVEHDKVATAINKDFEIDSFKEMQLPKSPSLSLFKPVSFSPVSNKYDNQDSIITSPIMNNSNKAQPDAKKELENKDVSANGKDKEKDFYKTKDKTSDYSDNLVESTDKKAKKKSFVSDDKKAKTDWKSSAFINLNQESDDEDDDVVEEYVEVQPKFVKAAKRKNKNKSTKTRTKVLKNIELVSSITVEDLAAKLAEKNGVLIKELAKMGTIARPTMMLDLDTAELLVTELGHNFNRLDKVYLEDEYINQVKDPKFTKERPPVVAIMGHVDHGKTTLLDTIRKSSVVSTESGGITQHIGAYQVKLPGGKEITFLDTPGHEAFTQIRSRGSSVTDIVVLVVAADDSVKPQTVEAIHHAQHAGVPIILAINKMDKPEANPMKVKTELLQHNVVVEEMGGDILCVEISAKENKGIDNLLESILLQAEIMALKTNVKIPAMGTIIEIKQEKGLGIMATVIVQRGTLRVGDLFVYGTQIGRVKAMLSDQGARLKEASLFMPVEISGFTELVEAGDSILVVPAEKIANEIVAQRLEKIKANETKTGFDLLSLLSKPKGDVKSLPLIIKVDTQGVLEAIVSTLNKIDHVELEVKVIHSGVGEITESDISLSKTAGAVIVGFNVRANTKARDLAKQENVELRYHSIIYNLVDDIKMILSGLLDPDIVENIIGYAEIREVFNITKIGNVAGCYVTEGTLKRNAYVRLLRNNIVIHNGVLSVLKRFKDDVKEVKHNFECGASFENYNDIKVGDRIECYEKVEVRNKLD